MRRRVLIDPGHGGGNLGIVVDELTEKDVTLELAMSLALSMHGPDCDLELTRYEDDDVPFMERREIEKSFDPDVVVSIHVNGLPGYPTAHGLEAYHWPGSSTGYTMALAAANAAPFPLRVDRVINVKDDPSTDADRWLENPRAVIGAFSAPTLLAECGYATNRKDRQLLMSEWGRQMVVSTLRQAIVTALWSLEPKYGV